MMTEDEAFIRAIVDTPGDDTSRLVYADWLDDRDDPRGPFLRAEREAGETGDIARLRKLASGLDPVWVARVSLPPLGVCCEGFAWSRRGALIDGADLDRFEARFGITLPTQYRAFLLNYNGGVIELDLWHTPDGIVYRDSCHFNSLVGMSGDDPAFSLEYELAVRGASLFAGTPREADGLRVVLRNSMIIATTPGRPAWVLLGVGSRNRGRLRLLAKYAAFEYVADRPDVPQGFGSLADYLLFLREYGAVA
jgi:uncharacterized protein (TIGR02996 family)